MLNHSYWKLFPRHSFHKILTFSVFVLEEGYTKAGLKVAGISLCRSSHQKCSVKKGVLRNVAKFTGNHLCQSIFFNKVAGACNFIKKETLAQVFSCEFCEISKNTFFTEHVWATASYCVCVILVSLYSIRELPLPDGMRRYMFGTRKSWSCSKSTEKTPSMFTPLWYGFFSVGIE